MTAERTTINELLTAQQEQANQLFTAQHEQTNQLLAVQHEQTLGIHRQNAEAFAVLNKQLSNVSTSLLTQGTLNNLTEF